MGTRICKELNLPRPIAVILTGEIPAGARPFATGKARNNCSLSALKTALSGETVYISKDSPACPGMKFGLGFVDNIVIPGGGGFEYFLSCGKGPGFPKGEKIKKNPETALDFHAKLPKKVHNSEYIVFKPLEETDLGAARLVIFLANPDQLAALIHLYSYESGYYDDTIAAMCSGCASVLRIPLAESAKKQPRAVIGLVDIFARPGFEPETFAFTVSAAKFAQMEENAKDCFFQSYAWEGVKSRLGGQRQPGGGV